MAFGQTKLLGLGLAFGTAVVLAGPGWLVWNAVRPEPFTPRTLRARFQSARFEAASLVFTYRIENRTRRSAYLAPNLTRIIVRHGKDRPLAGEAFVQLPYELAPRSSQILEVRLGLPFEGSQAGWASNQGPPSLDAVVTRSLESLDGFELVNERKGFRLLLPRGW